MGLIGPDSIFGPKKAGALTDGLTRPNSGCADRLVVRPVFGSASAKLMLGKRPNGYWILPTLLD